MIQVKQETKCPVKDTEWYRPLTGCNYLEKAILVTIP
jgi:hypothetical protein